MNKFSLETIYYCYCPICDITTPSFKKHRERRGCKETDNLAMLSKKHLTDTTKIPFYETLQLIENVISRAFSSSCPFYTGAEIKALVSYVEEVLPTSITTVIHNNNYDCSFVVIDKELSSVIYHLVVTALKTELESELESELEFELEPESKSDLDEVPKLRDSFTLALAFKLDEAVSALYKYLNDDGTLNEEGIATAATVISRGDPHPKKRFVIGW